MKKTLHVIIITSALIVPLFGTILASSPVAAAPTDAEIESACRDAGVPNERAPLDWCKGGFNEGESYCEVEDTSLSGYTTSNLRPHCLTGVQISKSGGISGGSLTTTGTIPANCADRGILGLPTWYRGVVDPANNCAVNTPSDTSGISTFIWKIVLNVIEMVVVLTAYIALGFILYGGFLFITGGSNPGSIEKGRKTLFNAVIGLVISLAAVAIVNLIFRIIP